jgi:organic hydroperoxide reductase OsmC/OhrA
VTVHRYTARASWRGSTGSGYDAYDRAHVVAAPPAEAELRLSADRAFLGDATSLNPEQLLVAAASSCQLLSFLALAARARVDVVSYEDDAEGVMDDAREQARIDRIVLRPEIEVAAGTSEERVLKLVERGHRLCYVANSLSTEIQVEATVTVR